MHEAKFMKESKDQLPEQIKVKTYRICIQPRPNRDMIHKEGYDSALMKATMLRRYFDIPVIEKER